MTVNSNRKQANRKRKDAEKMRKQIKKRTYHNMLTIYNALIVKGWGHEETLKMTNRIFDAIEENPQGHGVWWFVDMVIDSPNPIKCSKLSYR